MTKEEFIVEVESQKERGLKLLKQVQQMHVVKNNYGDGMAVFGPAPIYYTRKEELEPIRTEYEAWKCYVRDFLLSALEKDDGFISEWDKCLQEPYRHDISDKEWYSREINKSLGKLDSFVQRIGFRFKDNAVKEEIVQPLTSDSNKTPVVFISHSSADKDIIMSFVENVLILGLGLKRENIIFTSHDVYGVEPGDNIIEYIKKHIAKPAVVLLMISDNYKKSEVCLNEMGAAWAHGKKCLSVVLPNTGFDKLGWLSSFEKAERIDDKIQLHALCGKIGDLLNINMTKQLVAVGTYIEKFITEMGGKTTAIEATNTQVLKTGNADAVVMSAINKLGEFSLKELQAETGFKDLHYLRQKVSALVKQGTLIPLGSEIHRKYRLKD